jgi:hypothetical protein
VTLEEKRRRDREIALEDGVCSTLCSVPSCGLICIYVAEYVRAHQRREEEELDLDRE